MNSSNGLFHGRYKIIEHHAPLRPIACGFLFPGQGNAPPGMFAEAFSRLREFQSTFAHADQAAAYFDLLPFSYYIHSPQRLPAEQIHIYRSCALFCAEYSLGSYLLNQGIKPIATTGHSFGECAALSVSGIISFEEMLSIVIERNLLGLIPNALGSMLAVSASQADVEDLLREGVYLANINAPRQLVLAVAAGQLKETQAKLKQRRLANVLLKQLPQPYHSPLLKETREKFLKRLATLPIHPRKPLFACFSGVTHTWIDKYNFSAIDFAKLVADQFTAPVNFIRQIKALQDLSLTSLYEVGPTPALQTIVEANYSTPLRFIQVQQLLPEAREVVPSINMAKTQQSPWYKRLVGVIQHVTGYGETELGVGLDFQKDLGIDSIKRAEIFFKLLEQSSFELSGGISFGKIQTIAQAVDFLESYTPDRDPLQQKYQSDFKILRTAWKGTSNIINLSSVPSITCAKRFSAKPEFIQFLENTTEGMHWIGLEVSNETTIDTNWLTIFREKLQTVSSFEKKYTLCILDGSSLEKGRALYAFLASLERESLPWNVYLRIAPPQVLSDNLQISTTLFKGSARIQKFINGQWLALHFTELAVPPKQSTYSRVLAIGGTRGISFEILQSFPQAEKSHLLVLGRSPAASVDVQSAIQKISSFWGQVDYVSCDAGNEEALRSAIIDIFKGQTVDLVINAAGSESSQAFLQSESTELIQDYQSKLNPFRTIETLRKSLLAHAKIFHFSSIVSFFGNKGQSAYCLANASMDIAVDGKDSYTICWGPWENIGMASVPGIRERLRETGVSCIAKDIGVTFFSKIIGCPDALPPNLVVADPKDIFLFTLELEKNLLQPLGQVYDRFNFVFLKDLSLQQEAYLRDHVILNVTVLPAAYFLAQAFVLAIARFGHLSSLTDFVASSPIFSSNAPVKLKIQAFPRDNFKCQAYTNVINFSVNLAPSEFLSTQQLPPHHPLQSLRLESLYNHSLSQYGPNFQFIHAAYLDINKRIKTICFTKRLPKLSGDELFDFLLALFDLAAQTVGLQMMVSHKSGVLPLQYGAIRFVENPRIDDTIQIMTKDLYLNGSQVITTILLAKSDGSIFCVIEDARFAFQPLPKINTLSFESCV